MKMAKERNRDLLYPRLTKALKDAKAIHEYYQKIISCMPNNVYWLDRNCITQGCNENVLKLVGLKSLDQFVGITYEQMGKLAGWTEGQAESFKRDDMEVMSTGVAKFNVEEPPLYDEDGNPVYYISSRVPIFNGKGEVIGIVGISVDITERKKNEQALKEALDRAEAAETAFLANISHDIKTPLTGIIGGAEFLEQVVDNPEHKLRIENILKSGLRFYDFVEELIEVSRLGVEPVLKKRARFKLKDVIDSLVDLIKPAIESKSLTLSIDFEDGIPEYLIGNRPYLYRILLNLLSNAIKFTNQGGITIKISLVKKSKKEIVIKTVVSDTGIGIPKNKTQIIFDQFTRLAPAYEGNYEGSGLGLHIAKEFVEAMDGEIYVNSEEGKGSQFIFLVPLKVALSQLEDTDLTENADLSSIPKKKPTLTIVRPPLNETMLEQKTASQDATQSPNLIKILLVEDDALAGFAAKDTLQLLGYHVDIAITGEDALKQFKVGNHDVIFMDIGLPDISGIEVTKKIRILEENSEKKIPIIALSAHADRNSCLAAGMSAISSKPLLKAKAKEILNEQLNRKEELKIIDLELGASVVGGSIDTAKDMLKLFKEKSLPEERAKIEQAYRTKNVQELIAVVHKMHGGLCYCGAPRLKSVVKNFEITLKSLNLAGVQSASFQEQLDELYNNFCSELAAFLKAYENL